MAAVSQPVFDMVGTCTILSISKACLEESVVVYSEFRDWMDSLGIFSMEV